MKSIVYSCDMLTCFSVFTWSDDDDANGLTDAKQEAEKAGWQIDDHFGDLCPHCQKTQKPNPASPAKAQP